MRNLKRALSLLLAAAMLIGMMVVGASAVSYNDFPDRDEIVNKDAVSMLTTLGIIEGTDQGTYNPTGDVDRAQMAKMISVALTNNENCDTLYQNVNSGLTDIAANWARGYINYCYTLGIIAGRGNNTFDPSANVTGVEAAKMLLTALGYDANIEGLVGNDWALNTAALAQNLGIFRNFTKDVSEPLNRDDAALLIYNALDVELIQEYRNGYAISYDDHRTILSSVFGVIRVEGVVIGNEWAQLEETDSDAALQEGRTRLEDVVWYDSTTANTVVDEGVEVTDPVTFNVATPVDYMGKAVTLYVEKTTILSNSVVIGVATNDDMNTVVSSAANQSEDDDLLDGTGVAVDNSTQYYVNYGYQTRARALDLINDYDWEEDAGRFNNNGVEVEVIDNDDDGTAEYVLYTRETLSNVVRTSSRDETTTINVPVVDNSGMLSHTGNANNRSYTTTQVLDNEDIVTDLELAAEDLILYVQYGGRTYITAPEIVTDTMTRVDRDRNNEQYITLSNGDTYRMSYIREVLSMVDADVTRFEFNNTKTSADFDVNYEWILDSNGYIVDFRPAEETVKNYGLVLDSAWTQNALTKSGEVKILDATAIEHTYAINWNASRDAFDWDDASNSVLDSRLEDYLGTRDVNTSTPGTGYATGSAKGTVIEYSLNEAGDTLTITNVLNQNDLGTDNGLDTSVAATKGDITVDVDSMPIVYMEDNANTPTDDQNLQYTMTADYDTGDGNLAVSYVYGGQTYNKTFAIDRNTVAFYYDVVEDEDLLYNGRYYQSGYKAGDVLYGVATGWNQMGDVSAAMTAETQADGTTATTKTADVQVYPVISKQGGQYAASNLADVVLFNYELTTDTADWMLVLNANAVNSKTLELNVVFEDGTTAAIEVDRDDYDDTFYNNSNAYMKAYKYAVNANGEYTISESNPVGDTPASLLRDGTVDTNSAYQYLTITGDSKIWDVTDVDNAEDDVAAGSFDYANAKHAVIVRTNNNQSIKTAWVWDMDGDNIYGTSCSFNWTLDNYETVWAPTGGSSWVDYMVWTQIRDAFDAGKNVLIMGNATLAYPINIPADRTLQVEGNLITSATGNVTGNGSLRVNGTFYAGANIQVDTQAKYLETIDGLTIYNDVHVQNHARLGVNDGVLGNTTIATGVHLCARDDNDTGVALDAYDYVVINGHVETTGAAYYHNLFEDNSTNSMVINGDLYICNEANVAGKSAVVGNTSAGNLTVVGGTIYSTNDGHTDGNLIVNNGTVTLTSGSAINMDGNLTVNAKGRISQVYSYNARDVIANTVTVNGGEVAIYGDLVGLAGVDINGAANVSADEINAATGYDITIEVGADVSGNIAKNTEPTNTDNDGNRTYGGNYDGTPTPPTPETKVNVTVTVTDADKALSGLTLKDSTGAPLTSVSGNTYQVDKNTKDYVLTFTLAEGYEATVTGATATTGGYTFDVAEADVAIAINVTEKGTTPDPESNITGADVSGTAMGSYKFTINYTGTAPDVDGADEEAALAAINKAMAEADPVIEQKATNIDANNYVWTAEGKVIGQIDTMTASYTVSVNGTAIGTFAASALTGTVNGTVTLATNPGEGNMIPDGEGGLANAYTVSYDVLTKRVSVSIPSGTTVDSNINLVPAYKVTSIGASGNTKAVTLTGWTKGTETGTGDLSTNNWYSLGTELALTGAAVTGDGTSAVLTVNGHDQETTQSIGDKALSWTYTLDAADLEPTTAGGAKANTFNVLETATTTTTLEIDGVTYTTTDPITGAATLTSATGAIPTLGEYIVLTGSAASPVFVSTSTVTISMDTTGGVPTYKVEALNSVSGALTKTGVNYILVKASEQTYSFHSSVRYMVTDPTYGTSAATPGTGSENYYVPAKASITMVAYDATPANIPESYIITKAIASGDTTSVFDNSKDGETYTYGVAKETNNVTFKAVETFDVTLPAGVTATWELTSTKVTGNIAASTTAKVPEGAQVTLSATTGYVGVKDANLDDVVIKNADKVDVSTAFPVNGNVTVKAAAKVTDIGTLDAVKVGTVDVAANDYVLAGESITLTANALTADNYILVEVDSEGDKLVGSTAGNGSTNVTETFEVEAGQGELSFSTGPRP